VVVIEVPKENQKTVVDTLYTKFGITASTTGGLRLCPTSTTPMPISSGP
jgi:hypothetical protein